MDGSILEHTRRVAAQLAHDFASNPEGELELWVSTAQQREAMVVALYAGSSVEARLSKSAGEPAVATVARKAIGGIWAQEKSHTTLVEALRIVDESKLTAMRSLLGRIEGTVTHLSTTNGWLAPVASFLVGLGRATGTAPAFTEHLRALGPGEFFRLSHELELTAAEGYERILDLIDELEGARGSAADEGGAPALKFGLTARYEFGKTLAEERFHAAVFERLETWLDADGASFRDIGAQAAVRELRELAIENLSLGTRAVRPEVLRALGYRGLESHGPALLVSDGGLAGLFEEFGTELPLVAPAPRQR